MKLKRKIISLDSKKVEKNFFSRSCFNKFMAECRSSGNSMMGLIREYYEDLFKVFPPWNKHHLEMIILKIQYKLLKRDYYRAGIEMPPKVKQNYLASKVFNIDGITKSMQLLVKGRMLTYNKETGMVQKKKKTSAKVKTQSTKVDSKPTIAMTLLEIFSKQHKACLTDLQIFEQLSKIFKGKKFHSTTVSTNRYYYNKGKLPGQNRVPKTKLLTFKDSAAKAVKKGKLKLKLKKRK